MSFISILIALLLEQARPMAPSNPAYNVVRVWVTWAMRNLDAGTRRHSWLAWWVTVAVPGVLALAVHWLLIWSLGWIAATVWTVAILYLTLGFRQFSHHFTAIRDALDSGDEEQARHLLAQWMHIDASALPRSEIVRHVIEHSVLCAHRHVFGVLAWYTVLAALGLGPMGAVVYRMGEYVRRYVDPALTPDEQSVSPWMRTAAGRAWTVMDWVPARATALGFAFVGSFEEAVDGWRRHEASFPGDTDGVVLAATAGAVNVKLGPLETPGTGQTPQPVHLRVIVGLVWRTVVLWMVFLALITLAKLLAYSNSQ
jgi:adenosylcobinamide-phosphate synthase